MLFFSLTLYSLILRCWYLVIRAIIVYLDNNDQLRLQPRGVNMSLTTLSLSFFFLVHTDKRAGAWYMQHEAKH